MTLELTISTVDSRLDDDRPQEQEAKGQRRREAGRYGELVGEQVGKPGASDGRVGF